MELQAEWTHDCQGKQDFDADLVRLSSRFYPRGGGFSELSGGKWIENADRPSIPPRARATIYLQDRELASASFEGADEAEVEAKVEAWAREQFNAIVGAMTAIFR